jgi:hydroxyacylglutathione hydrolase
MFDIDALPTPGLGNRTYLVSDGEIAVVVDPPRDIDRVTALLDARGLRLSHVVETHVHNDYVSGGLQLAEERGAAYVVNAREPLDFDHTGITDGESFTTGTLRVVARHTPGHTPEHLSYVLHDMTDRGDPTDRGKRTGRGDEPDGDESGEGKPVAVFTGGSLLFGTVGRTDLIDPALTEELTRAQYRTARRLADELPDDVAVYPTHGFGSFCSSTPGTNADHSTIGDERRSNPALLAASEDAFVDQIVGGLTAYPRYYAHMGPRNRAGAAPIDLSLPEPVDATELRRRLHAGEWVVDVRDRVAFAHHHLVGTVNIELADNLATYLGWTIPWGTPVTLVADTEDQVREAQRMIARIGIDRPAGQAVGGPTAYADGDVRSYEVTDFVGVAKARSEGEVHVLDVRRDDEWDEGHIEGAQHVPLPDLEARLDELPADRACWVHCGSGFRAAIGASLLARAGRDVVLIDDDFDHAARAGLPITP